MAHMDIFIFHKLCTYFRCKVRLLFELSKQFLKFSLCNIIDLYFLPRTIIRTMDRLGLN